jgi:heterodisulfide reductase subunit C
MARTKLEEKEGKKELKDELDPKFKYELSEEPGGENIKVCFACGVCTASCPVAEVKEEFNPRKIIHMILLGMKDKVLSSDLLWFCETCYTCSFYCPQDVKFANVMSALRNIAVREGYVDPSFLEAIRKVDSYVHSIRVKMVENILDKKSKKLKIEPKEIFKIINKQEK